MPSYAVEALLKEAKEGKASFNVRPSDVVPKFTCRRQRVWLTNHDYGVDPLALEAMEEGSALHEKYGAMEIEVPEQISSRDEDGNVIFPEGRFEVCGAPMRGRIDWLFPDRIEDLKTSTPFWVAKFPSKEAKAADPTLRPYADIWHPKNDEDDISIWRIQLSLYRVLLEKDGKPAPAKGRVWKRLAGVKADTPGRWKKYDFDLLDEAGLEAEVGPWMRELAQGLQAAEIDPDAWKTVTADGRTMESSRKGLWKCNSCPLKDDCFKQDGMEIF